MLLRKKCYTGSFQGPVDQDLEMKACVKNECASLSAGQLRNSQRVCGDAGWSVYQPQGAKIWDLCLFNESYWMQDLLYVIADIDFGGNLMKSVAPWKFDFAE